MKVLLPPAALSAKSRKNDQGCLRSWELFCAQRSFAALPATAAALHTYIVDMPARVTACQLRHVVAAVRRWHLQAGLADPADAALLDELRRAQRRCRVPEMLPVHTHDLATIIDRIPQTPAGIRDVLLVLLSYAVRASSPAMSKLDRGDVHIDPRGMRLDLWYGRRKHSMTLDRFHDSRYCPVAAMERYLARIEDDEPALIRVCRRGRITARRLSLRRGQAAIRFRFKKAGIELPPVTALRAGMVVASTNRGAEEYAIMRQHGYNRTSIVRALQSRLGLNQIDVVDKLGM